MKLFYREKGNPDLPPLIILHGLWGASDNWLPVANLLASHFRVILPDCRNHGHSPHAPEMDYATLSEDVLEFIAQLHLNQQPFMAGHSMGGKTLMLLLLKRPEIVKKAAIIDILPQAYQTISHQNRHRQLLNFMITSSLNSYPNLESIGAMIRKTFPEEAYYQLLMKNIAKITGKYEWKINASALLKNLNSLLDWPTLQSYTSYTTPVLFIRGEYSDYCPERLPDTTRKLFPHATLTTIPQATHRIHADAPIHLAQTLKTFFLSSPS